MKRFDKTKNILKANILAEQRYLESKGLIKENELDMGQLGRDARSVESGVNQFGDEKYDEMQKLKNIPPDGIIKKYIDYYGKSLTYSIESDKEGIAKVEVYGEGEKIVATYYFKLDDLDEINRGRIGVSLMGGKSDEIGETDENYLEDVIRTDNGLTDKYNEYITNNLPDDYNPFNNRSDSSNDY